MKMRIIQIHGVVIGMFQDPDNIWDEKRSSYKPKIGVLLGA